MTTVLVTRPAGAGDPLVGELESHGYRVAAVPTVITRALPVEWSDLSQFDWVVLTSAAGVEALPGIPAGPRWAAVGEATAKALRARGALVDIVPEEANGAALAEALPDPAGARVLVVRASKADPDLPDGLRRRGAIVEEVTAYETVEGPAESAAQLRRALAEPDLAAVVFASGSAVRGFARLGGTTGLPAVSIGPRTSAVAREAGFEVVAEAAGTSVQELAAAVAEAIPKPKTTLPARPRRLRTNSAMRALVRETRLDPSQLIAPLFVVSGRGTSRPITSLKGHHRLTPDLALREATRLADLGVGGLLLFGIPDSKDSIGSGAEDPRGPVPETLQMLRAEGLPLVAYAEAGADIVGPSAMMDGQVRALRAGLDRAGFEDTAILAYASKHASSLYGPFREAAGSTPSFGDRKSYQMDPANARDALREMQLDADEGADILMVKPGITSLDLLARARDRFDLPLAAYQVSGEAAMIEAAAERGWLDRRNAILESITAIVRAGAGIVITYFAADVATWLREGR